MTSYQEKILREQIEKILGYMPDGIGAYTVNMAGQNPSEEIAALLELFSHTLSDRKAKLKEGVEELPKLYADTVKPSEDLVDRKSVLQLIEEVL